MWIRRTVLMVSVLLLLIAGGLGIASVAGAQSAVVQASSPSMTVTPQPGVRPLTVVVKGTPCATTKPPAGTTPHQIRISWQVADAPWTAQTRIIADGQDAEQWTTTLVLGVPNLGSNIITASCFAPGGQQVLTYPEQKVEVLPIGPMLAMAIDSIARHDSVSRLFDRAPTS